MNVGLLIASLSRNAGGIYDATRMLAQSIQKSHCCDLEVFGLKDAYTDSDLPGWFDLKTNALPVQGPKSFGFAPRLGDILSKSGIDLLHNHGLWMYTSRASLKWAQSTNKPYIISPHGMLDPWALCNSGWKKRLAGLFYEDAHLRGAACIHALCESEAESVRAYGLRNPICIIPNGINLPDERTAEAADWRARLPKGAKILFYLGRLHPKKGLANLLEAWAATDTVKSDWHLVIAGWGQGGHKQDLMELMRRLQLEKKVHFVGPQFGEAKHASYWAADAFVLPSFSEGLPMTVLEAWSCCLPVLMTPQCNLPEGFAASAAIRIAPEVVSIASGLSELLRMNDSERALMGARGYELVKTRFTWPTIAREMLAVYRWVLGQGEKPRCIQTV